MSNVIPGMNSATARLRSSDSATVRTQDGAGIVRERSRTEADNFGIRISQEVENLSRQMANITGVADYVFQSDNQFSPSSITRDKLSAAFRLFT